MPQRYIGTVLTASLLPESRAGTWAQSMTITSHPRTRRASRPPPSPPDHGENTDPPARASSPRRRRLGGHEPTAEASERRLERFGPPPHEGRVIRLRGSGAIVDGPDGDDGLRGSRQCGTPGFAAYAPTTVRGRLAEGLDLVVRHAGTAPAGGGRPLRPRPLTRARSGVRATGARGTRPASRRSTDSGATTKLCAGLRGGTAGRPAGRCPRTRVSLGATPPGKRRPWSAKAPGQRCPPAA